MNPLKWGGRYKLLSGRNRTWPAALGKLFDTQVKCSTKVMNKDMKDAYLWLDIFPFDSSPNDDKESTKLIKKFNILQALACKNFRSRNPLLSALEFILLLPISFISTDKILDKTEKLLDSIDKNTDYLENFVLSYDGINDKIRKDSFTKDFIYLEFEGHKFPCFYNYDEILTKIYGDYMKLPSENKRTNSGVIAWIS